LKKNVKVIASLVRKAKKKLYQDKREEALELMRKAVQIDDNNGVLIQVVKVIGRKQIRSGSGGNDEPQDLSVDDTPAEEPVPDEEMNTDAGDGTEEEPMEEPGEENVSNTGEPAGGDAEENDTERTSSMASEELLEKLFKASDAEYEKGHQQKAIAYLKKARKVAPDSPDVTERIDLLKARIKSSNLVRIGRKKLEEGDAAEAVVMARKAFEILPTSSELKDLLEAIEDFSPEEPEDPDDLDDIDIDLQDDLDLSDSPAGAGDRSSQDYITDIRQLVQDNSLEKAANLAHEAAQIYPDDTLICEFVDNFRKLGLLE